MNEDRLIYHEKQISSLCGQHTLNNLLGAPLYTYETLASIALELDERERGIIASDVLDTSEMANFMVSLVRENAHYCPGCRYIARTCTYIYMLLALSSLSLWLFIFACSDSRFTLHVCLRWFA